MAALRRLLLPVNLDRLVQVANVFFHITAYFLHSSTLSIWSPCSFTIAAISANNWPPLLLPFPVRASLLRSFMPCRSWRLSRRRRAWKSAVAADSSGNRSSFPNSNFQTSRLPRSDLSVASAFPVVCGTFRGIRGSLEFARRFQELPADRPICSLPATLCFCSSGETLTRLTFVQCWMYRFFHLRPEAVVVLRCASITRSCAKFRPSCPLSIPLPPSS